MKKDITSNLVVAYSKCQRKAFLLLRGEIKGDQHEYLSILKKHAMANRSHYISTLPNGQFDSHLMKHGGINFSSKNARSYTISVNNLVATCDALLKPQKKSKGMHTRIEPHIVIGTHSVSDDHKLQLAFAGYVVRQATNYQPLSGLIVPLTKSPRRIRLDKLHTKVSAIISNLQKQICKNTSEPPAICLNEHCQLCEFRNYCVKEAEQDDNISLLGRATPKLMQKYSKKGVFTVNQLSYLFKLRRRKRKAKKSLSFNIELQALAIRMNKIYLHEKPSLSKQSVELFLDIEGIPDQSFDYLIGLLVRNGTEITSYSYWADSMEDEAMIFQACLDTAAKYNGAPIYHYGSYETRSFQRAAIKYQLDCKTFTERLININSFIFGKIYFPTRSNKLKDLGAFTGASWSTSKPSGIQSLVWRHRWEETKKEEYKDSLLAYNLEDCQAVRLVTEEIQHLSDSATSRLDVDFADNPKQNSTELGEEIHQTFDNILNSAHLEYSRKRIKFQSNVKNSVSNLRKIGAPKGHSGHFRAPPSKAQKVVKVRRPKKCPRHKGKCLDSTNILAEHNVIDLVFTKNGCKKSTVKYIGMKGYCPKCHNYYNPPAIRRFGGRLFSHRFQAWTAYQRIALRLPYRAISQMIEDIFSEQVTPASIVNFIRYLATYYSHTDILMLRRILASPFIHVDETKISIQGTQQYVWVLTNGTYVVFKLTETRETAFLQEILQNYEGVLISDFYPGYDSFPCKQQKCLSHLIKDLNNDLWNNPFNKEYELFLIRIRDLLIPLFEDVERYGLKARYLKKHIKAVNKFYKQAINNVQYKCEIVKKYQKRFTRYRESLFLFLIEDGIPWNNNMAERALRHLAIQRKISGSFFKKGATNYLKLLGIAQTCRFQGKSFLKFLLSEKRDVDKHKERRRHKLSK